MDRYTVILWTRFNEFDEWTCYMTMVMSDSRDNALVSAARGLNPETLVNVIDVYKAPAK